LGYFLPTYSGRLIEAGTWRIGEIRPGRNVVTMI
jgi:hypothetical protein